MSQPPAGAASRLVERSDLNALIGALRDRGYAVVGPTIRDDAIVYAEIVGVDDLPVGWTDEQDGGTYRLRRRDDDALFGYAVGPQSWKQFLFPPRTLLMRARRGEDGFDVEPANGEQPAFAFLGVRGCELAAIQTQDRVFMSAYADPTYAGRRSGAFIVAVDCSTPAGTCFCTSMGTGPKAGPGYDLSLTELMDGDAHRFLVEVGTERGAEVLAAIPHGPAAPADERAAAAVVECAAASMGRQMRTDDIKELLYASYEHPRWDDVASRCLACANCTMVCPTCFCSTVEDTTDLTGEHTERWRSWDSCFTLDFSEMGGSAVRGTTRSRYRQWMTHKLATWIDQFGTSGCVGCGRCITWCPVGIDITEEVRAIREQPSQMASGEE
ncbi:MAG TPA: 4Fe-4S dicluster domain-containing protein [Egibacteraceae bacterium]|nr:4Fe-4S dicluster domain-containing protein [Egibacteraceae bacterium]